MPKPKYDFTTTFQMLTTGQWFIRLRDVGKNFRLPLLVKTINGAIFLTGPNKGMTTKCGHNLQIRAVQ